MVRRVGKKGPERSGQKDDFGAFAGAFSRSTEDRMDRNDESEREPSDDLDTALDAIERGLDAY